MNATKPYIAVILLQSIYAGMAILSNSAFDGGMNTAVFVFYRQTIATIFLTPFALAFERRTAPPLRFKLAIKIFVLAFVGITFCLNVHSMAIKYTSATVAAASINMVPVITFFLAVLLRMEAVKLKSISGIAKIIGVAFCLAGIILVAFYKGPHLNSPNHHHPILHAASNHDQVNTNSNETWTKGSFLMIAAVITWAMWIVLQGLILREYPSKLLFTALSSFFSTVQSFFVGMAFESDLSKWKLHLDAELLAVAYTGILVAGVGLYLQAWCIEKRGPVFMAMSSPLCLIITIVGSFFLLGEIINLGSVLGGLLMVGGLYSVLWGKSRERIDLKPNAQEEADQPDLYPASELATPIRLLELLGIEHPQSPIPCANLEGEVTEIGKTSEIY